MSAQKKFILKLLTLRDEAGRLRLYRTMHALDAAVKEIGWEVAEKKKEAK